MKQRLLILFLSLAGLILLAGCGGGGGSSPGSAKNTLHESETCIGCHEGSNWNTPGTGQPVVSEWKASTHNSTTDGASCQDCHGSGYMHPTSCNKCHSVGVAGSNLLVNPDAEDRCANCHGKVNPRPSRSDGFASSLTRDAHFNPSDGTTRLANYVATNYKQNCRKCHNPHDTAYGREQRKQWAESGHGSTVTANANRDFKLFGSSIPAKDNFGSYCVRCHTSTGYIKYVTSGFSDVQALPDLDKSRETVSCNVCHFDGRVDKDGVVIDESAYSGRLRVVGAVTTYYNYSTSPRHPLSGTNPSNPKEGLWDVKLAETYPDYNSSNICIPCHSGREIGKVIRRSGELLNNYSSTASRGIFAHDRSAASTLNSISGFEFYTDRSRYLDPDLKHNGLNSVPSTGPNAGRSNGPCITCHMENESSHHFLPVTRSVKTDSQSSIVYVSRVCGSCHYDAWVNTSKTGYRAALTALQKLVTTKLGVATSASTSTVTGLTISYGNTVWRKSTDGFSADANIGFLEKSVYTIGAVFNLEMFQLDPGAYAHNPLYVRRLIYDSIDWLNNKAMDGDVKVALGVLYPATTADATYVAALQYICKTPADLGGTLGNRP